MNINKLAPWNWLKKEQETQSLPVRRTDAPAAYAPDSLMRVHESIDRMFDDMFRGFGLSLPGFSNSAVLTGAADWWKPTVDIASTDKEYTITAELPGVDPKNVKLELDQDTLRIRGEKKDETEEKDRQYYSIERRYGSFQRVLSLPEDADSEHIDAKFKEGVMTVTIPRKAAVKSTSRTIEVKAA